MDAVEYIKVKARMSEFCCKCRECVLNSKNNDSDLGCTFFELGCPEKAVEMVEHWSKEHPVKTYLSVLLEKFPNIKINNYGFITSVCPHNLFKQVKKPNECIALSPIEVCKACWNREYKEEE